MMDTNAYDVNVSPDKKTIMLHNQTILLESLKFALTDLFQSADHTLPQSQLQTAKLPGYKPLTVRRDVQSSAGSTTDESEDESSRHRTSAAKESTNTIEDWAARGSTTRKKAPHRQPDQHQVQRVFDGPRFMDAVNDDAGDDELLLDDDDDQQGRDSSGTSPTLSAHSPRDAPRASLDAASTQPAPRSTPRDNASPQMSFQRHTGTPQQRSQRAIRQAGEEPIPSVFNTLPKVASGPINDAFARMRSRRGSPEGADITIGDHAVRTVVSGVGNFKKRRIHTPKEDGLEQADTTPSQGLLNFAMPGSKLAMSARSMQRNHSGHSDSDVELTDMDGTPVLTNSTTLASSLDRNAYNLGLTTPPQHEMLKTPTPASHLAIDNEADDDETEDQRREREDLVVAQLIEEAETQSASRTLGTSRRAAMLSQVPTRRKGLTYNLSTTKEVSLDEMRNAASRLGQQTTYPTPRADHDDSELDAETKLSLTVSKADFARMVIVGQFNDGFILAVRPQSGEDTQDELFIIDQHAADEKANYERLQKTEVLQRQPLVHPKILELTAVEEEVVSTRSEALRANGFEIEALEDDDSGRAYRLLSLPTMRNTTFKVSDLEELLHLLSELSVDSSEIPRPRKVQKHLAMKACRSSIMIGKTLRQEQMVKVVRHMGGMEKPWNCPHGRPTMRHLRHMGSLQTWQEGDSVEDGTTSKVDWQAWLQEKS